MNRRFDAREPFLGRGFVKVAAISHPRITPALGVGSSRHRPGNHGSSPSDAVLLLQVFALAVMVFPSDTVITSIGAAGYPASLVGLFIFLVFSATVLLGLHDPTRHRHPIKAVLCVLWLSVLGSYILMDRGVLTGTQQTGADRVLLQLAVVTGVALVAAEWLRSLSDVRRVLRALAWGGAFCGVVAALQFSLSLDLAQYLRDLPGFTVNHDNPALLNRGTFNRVTGTAITPIELGVVAGMLIPVAIYVGLYDRDKSALKRWAPVALSALGVATSVSRSAIISVVVAFAVLVVLMPPVPRLVALCVVPFGVAGAFMSAHGLIGTLASFFSAGTSDSSIAWRVHDYSLVERLWREAPWFGHGGGTYIPDNPLNIFDNQYLHTTVELGVVGVLALIVFLVLPSIAALMARGRSRNPELRLLCAALAGPALAAGVCSFTFDSLSFPMFVNVYALVIGLIGTCCRLAVAEGVPATDSHQLAPALPSLIKFRPRAASWRWRMES
jgi:O-Antigen ligase